MAFAVNGLSSIGNLAVSVSVARGEPLGRLGQFALAFSIYVLVTGLSRTTVTESVLAERAEPSSAEAAYGARRACLLGVLTGAVVVVVGVGHGSSYLAIAGGMLPGLVLYDYVKAMSLGAGETRVAVVQEGLWTGCVLTITLSALVLPITPVLVFATWATTGALIGVLTAVGQRYPVRPGWNLDRRRTKVSAIFAAQFLVTTGSAQLALTGLAVVGGAAGVAVVGALGAARTVFGPVALLTATLNSLIVPFLARSRPRGVRTRLRTAGPVVGLTIALSAPVVIGVCLLPDRAGAALLADNWAVARPLLPLIAVEVLLAPIALVGFAGHRVQGAGGRALLIGGVLGPIRVVSIVAGGVLFGAYGAAGGLALIVVVSASCWCVSYLTLDVQREKRWRDQPSG
ncbi:hypothetical protein [Micromonospora sp. NBC_01739]|uniref:hypothetical protein n=1 Tax=Micromonospora sp. NBC_01739 TaxID=2975985 RepID=UPI002E154D32|nr:hypothetical protein OIE53_13280 [Micromonospora sp. NBC_01739]